MPEVPSILNDAPANRAPAAAAWKLLYTATQTALVSIHINNGNPATVSGYRVAIVPASVAGFVDGSVPPGYAMVSGSTLTSVPIEALQELDTPVYNLSAGDKVVVWCDNTLVTFLSQGYLFS